MLTRLLGPELFWGSVSVLTDGLAGYPATWSEMHVSWPRWGAGGSC